MNQSIISEQDKLDYLFSQISLIEDDELKAHWAKYLCIMVSCFIENTLRTLISEYSVNRANRNIANFVRFKIQNITNLNEERISQVLAAFNSDWHHDFKNGISNEQKDAFDTIIANRHLISHGRAVGITYIRVSEYFRHIKPAIQLIDNLFNSTR